MVVRAIALKGSKDVDYSFSQHHTGGLGGGRCAQLSLPVPSWRCETPRPEMAMRSRRVAP
jgi:hypothetical protein